MPIINLINLVINNQQKPKDEILLFLKKVSEQIELLSTDDFSDNKYYLASVYYCLSTINKVIEKYEKNSKYSFKIDLQNVRKRLLDVMFVYY